MNRDCKYVRDNYPDLSLTEIARRLKRSRRYVRKLARQADVVVHATYRWTAEEVRILRNQYGNSDLRWLCGRLRRTSDAVRHKAAELNLGYSWLRSRKRWTENEEAELRRLAPDLLAMAEATGRSFAAVRIRCSRLGISCSKSRSFAFGKRAA